MDERKPLDNKNHPIHTVSRLIDNDESVTHNLSLEEVGRVKEQQQDLRNVLPVEEQSISALSAESTTTTTACQSHETQEKESTTKEPIITDIGSSSDQNDTAGKQQGDVLLTVAFDGCSSNHYSNQVGSGAVIDSTTTTIPVAAGAVTKTTVLSSSVAATSTSTTPSSRTAIAVVSTTARIIETTQLQQQQQNHRQQQSSSERSVPSIGRRDQRSRADTRHNNNNSSRFVPDPALSPRSRQGLLRCQANPFVASLTSSNHHHCQRRQRTMQQSQLQQHQQRLRQGSSTPTTPTMSQPQQPSPIPSVASQNALVINPYNDRMIEQQQQQQQQQRIVDVDAASAALINPGSTNNVPIAFSGSGHGTFSNSRVAVAAATTSSTTSESHANHTNTVNASERWSPIVFQPEGDEVDDNGTTGNANNSGNNTDNRFHLVPSASSQYNNNNNNEVNLLPRPDIITSSSSTASIANNNNNVAFLHHPPSSPSVVIVSSTSSSSFSAAPAASFSGAGGASSGFRASFSAPVAANAVASSNNGRGGRIGIFAGGHRRLSSSSFLPPLPVVGVPENGNNVEEEEDASLLFGTNNDDDNNSMFNNYNRNNIDTSSSISSSCGWTEVMATTTTTTSATRGMGGGVGGAIGGVINNHSTTPSPRSLHSAALLNGVMYIFGGYDGNQRVNSFHAYSFADKRWSPVLPSANSGNPPSPRDRHVSVAFANSFYVHGGFDGTARDGSLFSFDFSTMSWREVVASHGRAPSARHSHAAVVHDHSMYVFGGYDGSYKSDLHEFDFTLSRWSAVPAVGRRPRARYRATCVVYKNFMILYGGHDGTRHLSDTFTFDFDTLTWNTLITEVSHQPTPRDSHVAVVHGNSMYVFGGSSGVALNDFHELQLPGTNNHSLVTNGTARWRRICTSSSRSDTLQPHRRFCHVAVAYNDSMYVFGGYDGADRLNSFIKFDFAMYDLSFDIPPSTLIQDFRSFVNNEKLSDITFIVEGESIYAHKLMLMRCSYFQALFCGHMRESNMDTIRIEQVRYPIFLGILEYLYTDQLSSMPFHTAMEYFEAADLFCIPRLKTICEKRMLQSITIENAASIFHAADMHSATLLRQKSKKYILTHFEDVSKTGTFEEMGRQNVDLVFELLHSR